MRIAHITDLHVLEWNANRRRGAERVRLELICNGRPIDPEHRRRRVVAALDRVRELAVDHLVVTGDLTEDGHPEQFEALADVFAEAGIDPGKTTLIAGNHDAYQGAAVFDEALGSVLAPFAPTSRACQVIDLGAAVVIPMCTRMEQPFVRAAGAVGASARQWLRAALDDLVGGHRPVVVAMHHPLLPRSPAAFQWFDGLVDATELTDILVGHPNVSVLHGHWHRAIDLPIGGRGAARSHGARAACEHPLAVRVYHADDARLAGTQDRGPTLTSEAFR